MLCIFSITALDIWAGVTGCVSTLDDASDQEAIVTFVAFYILAALFLTCGLISNCLLRKHFPHFYTKFKCVLWLACFSLAVPLLLRAIVDNLLYSNKGVDDWYQEHFVIAIPTFFILTTYIPIASSLFSLVFGFLRKRQDAMLIQTEDQIEKNLDQAGEVGTEEKTSESALDQSYFTSDGRSFFDPPIENYKRIYGTNTNTTHSGKALPETGQAQQNFFRMRRLKQQQSGVGGTGNFTEGTETDNNESCAPPRNDDRFSFTLSAQGGT